MSDTIKITVDGSEYSVERGQGELRTVDGRRAILQWVETFPEQFVGYRIVAELTTPRVLWTGTLATGGRTAQEFEAQIVMGPSGPAVLRRNGLATEEVSAHQILAEYWLRALVALTTAQ